ncbi:MAG: Rieske (2Fe-2S) protein [Candidatus Binatia bacterium]
MRTERVLRLIRGAAPAVCEVDLGPEDAIPLGQGRAFLVRGSVIAVFRQRDGCLFAIDGRCPHRGGPLAEGIVGDGKVICPLHGWKIDLASGRCLGESAAVRVHGVRRAAGRIRLMLPEER